MAVLERLAVQNLHYLLMGLTVVIQIARIRFHWEWETVARLTCSLLLIVAYIAARVYPP